MIVKFSQKNRARHLIEFEDKKKLMKYHTVRVPRNLGPFFFCHRTGNPRRTDRQWRPRGIGGTIFEPSSDLENLVLNFRKKTSGRKYLGISKLAVSHFLIKQGRSRY